MKRADRALMSIRKTNDRLDDMREHTTCSFVLLAASLLTGGLSFLVSPVCAQTSASVQSTTQASPDQIAPPSAASASSPMPQISPIKDGVQNPSLSTSSQPTLLAPPTLPTTHLNQQAAPLPPIKGVLSPPLITHTSLINQEVTPSPPLPAPPQPIHLVAPTLPANNDASQTSPLSPIKGPLSPPLIAHTSLTNQEVTPPPPLPAPPQPIHLVTPSLPANNDASQTSPLPPIKGPLTPPLIAHASLTNQEVTPPPPLPAQPQPIHLVTPSLPASNIASQTTPLPPIKGVLSPPSITHTSLTPSDEIAPSSPQNSLKPTPPVIAQAQPSLPATSHPRTMDHNITKPSPPPLSETPNQPQDTLSMARAILAEQQAILHAKTNMPIAQYTPPTLPASLPPQNPVPNVATLAPTAGVLGQNNLLPSSPQIGQIGPQPIMTGVITINGSPNPSNQANVSFTPPPLPTPLPQPLPAPAPVMTSAVSSESSQPSPVNTVATEQTSQPHVSLPNNPSPTTSITNVSEPKSDKDILQTQEPALHEATPPSIPSPSAKIGEQEAHDTEDKIKTALIKQNQSSSPDTNMDLVNAWEEKLEILERENIALRDKLHLKDNDKLNDIKVDAITQIREDVLHARVLELEKQLDKMRMEEDPNNNSDATKTTKEVTLKDVTKAIQNALPPPPPPGKAGEPSMFGR